MSNQVKPAPTTPAGTATRSPMSTGSTGPQHLAGITHERIAKRAYEKWCQRGCPAGTHQQDWLEAEAELRTEMAGAGVSRVSGTTPQASPMPQKPSHRS